MMRIRLEVFVAMIAVPIAVEAQHFDTEALKQADALRCFFQTGNGFAWNNGDAMTRSAEAPTGPIVLDEIDRGNGSARIMVRTLRTNEPQYAAVAVLPYETPRLPGLQGRSTYGLTFLEVSAAGSVSVITVWSPADTSSLPREPRSYPAVWSAHFALDVPAPEQNPGWCRVER